jgi:hypothetical protein
MLKLSNNLQIQFVDYDIELIVAESRRPFEHVPFLIQVKLDFLLVRLFLGCR